MDSKFPLIILLASTPLALGQFGIESLEANGTLTVTNAFGNGVVEIDSSPFPDGPWLSLKNVWSTQSVARAHVGLESTQAYYRAQARNLSPAEMNGRVGFTNLIHSFGRLTTIAGAGGLPAAIIKWRAEYEGGPATNAELSRPHIALSDDDGNIYIADKDAHGIRKVLPDGRIFTVAGINAPGDGPDTPTLGTASALNQPNGLWIAKDNTVYIYDLGNFKIRRLDTNGMVSTLLWDPSVVFVGRGLWVSDDESLAYFCSGTELKTWTPQGGISILSDGFVELGNIDLNRFGDVIATDRGGHRVWRVESDGGKAVIAGNGLAGAGVDGARATETSLNEVRSVWMLPSGAYFLATHRGSQIWYVDTAGYIHLFLNGDRSDTRAGDGTWFYNPLEFRIAEPRAITADRQGNLLITENDAGYVRKIEFKRFEDD